MNLFATLLFCILRAAVLWLSLNFIHAATATTAPGCVGGGAADVVFLLHSSYSVWRPDFRRQLTFVQEVIERLPIGPNDTRVAIVTYADYPQLQFHLHEYSAKPDLRAAVEEIRQRGGFQTITGDAIRFVRRNVFEVGLKSRPLGVNVARVAVVITDGRSDNRTATVIEADLAKQEGVRMFLVGVGKEVDLEELKDIGSLPSDYYTFLIDNFAGLAGLRDLVATKTCKVAESVRSTKVFANSTTSARLGNTKAVSTEKSFGNSPLIKEIPTKPDYNNNASLAKATFKAVRIQVPASTKKTSVKATLIELVSTRVDSTSTTATASSPKSTLTRPTFVRTASSRPASTTSSVAVTSPVSSATTYKTTSVSTWKLFPETAMLPPVENVSLPSSTSNTGAEGFRQVEDLQPPSKDSSAVTAISDRDVQTEYNETTTSKRPYTVFPTRKSEVTDEPIANSSDFQPSEDSTDDPHKITTGLEISCGFGLLDKILNGKSSSEAPTKDRETENEKDRDEEQHQQQRSITAGNNDGIDSGAKEAQQTDDEISSYTSRSTPSIPVTLAQVAAAMIDVSRKTALEATSTKSTRRANVTNSTTTTKSSLMDGPQERKAVITSGYDNWAFYEPRVLANNKETSDQDDSDRLRKREDNGRLDHESGYQGNDYWRLTDGGVLTRYRMISPGVYVRETRPSYRTPRLEPNPRRIVISRPEAIQSSAVDDQQGQDKRHLNRESTEGERRGNVSRAAHSGQPAYRSRLIARTKGRRGGYPRGSGIRGTPLRHGHTEAIERRSRERSRAHKPQANSSGFWRINDSGQLVWKSNPQKSLLPLQSHATGNPSTTFPRAETANTLNNPGFSPTHSRLKVHGADHLASNSGAHPRLTTVKPMVQRPSFVTDVIDSFSKQRSTRSPKPSGAEIRSHNPKEGFWRYDRYGRNSVWVSYTRSDDAMRTDNTTDAQATTYASVNPTSGSKGPSLINSDGLSYGYWRREKGKPVWYECQSTGIYRRVIDTDSPAVPHKIRIELPPGMVLGCTGYNRTGAPVWNGPVKVNQSSSSEEVVVITASDKLEKLMLNRTRPITLYENRNRDVWQRFPEGSNSAISRSEEISTLLERTENKMSVMHHYNRTFSSSSDHGSDKTSLQFPTVDPVVRGTDKTGNNRGNMQIGGSNGMNMERGRSQRKSISTGVPQGLDENHRTSSTSTTVNPRRDGAIWSAKTASTVSSSPTRTQQEPGNSNRVVGTDSVSKRGSSTRKNLSATKSKRKHAKGCVARPSLDVVFVVDPRARKRPYSRHLWQLAYEVVSQLPMDNDRIRVRFYPELEVVKAATATNGSADHGSVQTVIQKVTQKPVPELLRAASRLLAKSEKGARRIGIYLTDGPSGTPRDLDQAAEEVKGEAAVEMFAVGVGQETDPTELETIADSKLKGKHLFRLTKPLKPDIDAVAIKLTRALCGER